VLMNRRFACLPFAAFAVTATETVRRTVGFG
jgi:hypothetical protein